MSNTATKNEIKVLYQIDSDISDLDRIAAILPDLDIRHIKEAASSLQKNGMVREADGKLMITDKGKAALEKHKFWAFE